MLQHLQIVLEERLIERPVHLRSERHELLYQEDCVSIFVLPHMLLIALEKLHDGLEEVGSDVTYAVR